MRCACRSITARVRQPTRIDTEDVRERWALARHDRRALLRVPARMTEVIGEATIATGPCSPAMRVIGLLGLVACTTPAAVTGDASVDARAHADADVDGTALSWATYTIAPGAHAAKLTGQKMNNPIAGFTNVRGRDFQFIFDPSASYVLTAPVDPNDQLDWNKLPGISDCGTIDLSADGAMFGWRWRLDLTPNVLEITAYANNAHVHLTPREPLVILDADDLAAREPLHYRLERDGAEYRFAIGGMIRGRSIAVTAALPRRCASAPTDSLVWGAGFYFGGTSTAPSTITGRIDEAAL